MKPTITISLSPELHRHLHRASKTQHRSLSELVEDALRFYLDAPIRRVAATPVEVRKIERGRKAHDEGEYVTLGQLFHDLDNPRRPARRTSS